MLTGPAHFFGDYRISLAHSGTDHYGHSFGGPHDRKGASRADCKGIHIHLLHRMNVRDPLLPLSVPGVSWIPFYYCFDFRANHLGYRLISDDLMEAYFPTDDPHVSATEKWPDADYPEQFSRSQIKLARREYNPTRLEDAYHWAGIFGIDKLSAGDQREARQHAAEDCELMTGVAPGTEEEFNDSLSLPFLQGRPADACLNPGCPNRKRKDQLLTVAIIPGEPIDGVHIFGQYGDGVIVIVQQCPKCHAFRVSNQAA